MAYRSTVHPATGETPSKLMFGREIRTKIPELSTNYHHINDDVKDTNVENKMKMKAYRDQKVRARESDIQIGDRVLLLQRKEDKLSTAFRNEEFEVIDRNGTQVTVESPTGARYTRNTSHIKPIITEGQISTENRELVLGIPDVRNEINTPAIIGITASDSTTAPDAVDSSPRLPRPTRTCAVPRYLDDYVRY